MNIFVFSGPSFPSAEARTELDATYFPPVSEGDIIRAVERHPVAIGIIDGYFENVPSVWHKEILYALDSGIHVYGAASMGALRAAELEPFGMIGVGAVFEAFRNGLLEDDDEVAVIHGPPELGYPLLSEAMINIRRTLSDALACGVISKRTRKSLEAMAKALPYKERTYHNVLRIGVESDLPRRDLERFSSWLPEGRVDQKRNDAIAMLRAMRERFKNAAEPRPSQFYFERTTIWEQALHLAVAHQGAE